MKLLFIGAGASLGAREHLGKNAPPLGNGLISYLCDTIESCPPPVLKTLFIEERESYGTYERVKTFLLNNRVRNYEKALNEIISTAGPDDPVEPLINELNRLISFSMRWFLRQDAGTFARPYGGYCFSISAFVTM